MFAGMPSGAAVFVSEETPEAGRSLVDLDLLPLSVPDPVPTPLPVPVPAFDEDMDSADTPESAAAEAFKLSSSACDAVEPGSVIKLTRSIDVLPVAA